MTTLTYTTRHAPVSQPSLNFLRRWCALAAIVAHCLPFSVVGNVPVNGFLVLFSAFFTMPWIGLPWLVGLTVFVIVNLSRQSYSNKFGLLGAVLLMVAPISLQANPLIPLIALGGFLLELILFTRSLEAES